MQERGSRRARFTNASSIIDINSDTLLLQANESKRDLTASYWQESVILT